jgi:hypothetical protein
MMYIHVSQHPPSDTLINYTANRLVVSKYDNYKYK